MDRGRIVRGLGFYSYPFFLACFPLLALFFGFEWSLDRAGTRRRWPGMALFLAADTAYYLCRLYPYEYVFLTS